MRIAFCLVAGLLIAATPCAARTLVFQENLENAGLTIEQMTDSFLEVTYRLDRVEITDVDLGDRVMQQVSISGLFLPNDEGSPNLPGFGRFVAIPEGATARLDILYANTETVEDIDVIPAPPLPLEGDDSPPVYRQNPAVYSLDAQYPTQAVRISGVRSLRGVDAVLLGITPFQYNPVRRELTVFSEVRVRVTFEGGSGRFGDDRLRSRYWEPILQANLTNYAMLPEIEFPTPNTRDDEYEYVIVVPDLPAYVAWADTLRRWRTLQGIDAGVVTLTETGATSTSIESWVNTAYNTWETPPAAILLLADYVSEGTTTGITSPVYNSYCISDNIYGDVDGDHLPDIVMARMTATPTTLARLVTKAIQYERTPPTDPGYYQNPVVACGWQTERWFTICSEIVYGFLANVHGKTPVREYAIYSGTPGSSWSSNQNTYMLVNYFGPNGLGYIPATADYLTDWGGNATRINNDINAGAFIVHHRDHGSETGWGEPAYGNSNLGGLSNTNLPFVFSMNCLTGKFNMSGDCFTEAFHRMEHGALGLIGATEVSYSFVNDVFIFGIFDCLWPEFDPGYPTEGLAVSGDLRPAFGNASGKYYLEASNWPYNPGDKEVTYYLFHAHTDAFQTLYSEVPQDLTVSHPGALVIGMTAFPVTADDGSVIALTIGDDIIGVADGTGAEVEVPITPATLPGTMTITITKPNYYRYSADVPIITPDGPFLMLDHNDLSDAAGDADAVVDVGEPISLVTYLENFGDDPSTNTVGVLSGSLVVLTDDTEPWGTIASHETRPCDGAFDFTVAPGTPDQTDVGLALTVACEETTFAYSLHFVVEAPVVDLVEWTVDDTAGGDGDHMAEPGETVDLSFRVSNTGHEGAYDVTGVLSSTSYLLTMVDNTASVAEVPVSGEAELSGYTVTIDPTCPPEMTFSLHLALSADFDYQRVLNPPLPVSPFFDEFEADFGWTVSGAASTGAWAQADPEGTVYNSQPCQPENDHTPAPGRRCMVTGPMAGSSAGQYDVDNGYTILTSPVFDLGGAVSATIEYWRWYTNNLGAGAADDWWTVQVSNDDGVTWTYLEHTQESANWWQKFSFDLEDYVLLTDHVRVRFIAADEGAAGLVEAAVDDVLLFRVSNEATVVADGGLAPRAEGDLALLQNRPNPFNPVTEITYRIPSGAPSEAALSVYDCLGRSVATLVHAKQGPGTYTVLWDGKDAHGVGVASGVYFCRLTWNGESRAMRMVLLK